MSENVSKTLAEKVLSPFFGRDLSELRDRNLVHLKHTLLAVVFSPFAALAGVAVVYLYTYLGKVAYDHVGPGQTIALLSRNFTQFYWPILVILPVSGLLVALFVRFVMPSKSNVGFPHIFAALYKNFGKMHWLEGVGAAIVACIGIAGGASVGRTGPTIHLATGLSATFANLFRIERQGRLIIIGAAVAAALGANLGAPLGAAIFVHEVLFRHLSLRTIAPTLIAAFVGKLVGHYFIPHPFYEKAIAFSGILSPIDILALVIAGVAAGFTTLLYRKTLIRANTLFPKINLPIWIKAPIGGLILALIALVFPQVLGLSGPLTANLFDPSYLSGLGFFLLLAIFVAKVLSIGISFGSGFGGGVFAPALLLGNVVGGLVAILFSSFTNDPSLASTLIIAAGAGVLSCFFGAPFGVFVFSLEFGNSTSFVFPVLITLGVAHLTHFWLYGGRNHFDAALRPDGIELSDPLPTAVFSQLKVDSLLRPVRTLLKTATTADFERLSLEAQKEGDARLYVTTPEGTLVGVLSAGAESPAAYREVPSLSDRASLEEAARLFKANPKADAIAVIGQDNRLLGEILASDLLESTRLVQERRSAEANGIL